VLHFLTSEEVNIRLSKKKEEKRKKKEKLLKEIIGVSVL